MYQVKVGVSFDKLWENDTWIHHAKDNHNTFRLEVPRRSTAREGGDLVFVTALTPFRKGLHCFAPLPHSLTGRIRRGDEIEVLDNELVVSRGVVDDYTADRHVVWLRLSYGRGRRMFHQQDGWQLRPVRKAP